MAKNVEFTPQPATEPENIEVIEILGDRVIFEPIKVVPKQRSQIIDPNTNQPVEASSFDRHPLRGVVFMAGEQAMDKIPGLKPGAKIFIEVIDAAYQMTINAKNYAITRTSNIVLVYEDK